MWTPETSLIRWGGKAVGGLAANLALLTVWVDGLGWPPELAVLLNWLLISVAGYWVTDRWVYPDGRSPSGVRANLRRYLGLESVMLASKAVNYGIYLALLYVSVEYRIAWVVGAVVTFALSYVGSRLLWQPGYTAT